MAPSPRLLLLAGVLAGTSAGCSPGTVTHDDHDAIAQAVATGVAVDETDKFADAADLTRGLSAVRSPVVFDVSCTDTRGDQLLLCSSRTDRADISGTSDVLGGNWSATNVATEAVRFDGMGTVTFRHDADDRHYKLDGQVRYDRIQLSHADHQLIFGYATYYLSIDRTGGGDGDVTIDLEAMVKVQDDGTAILGIDGEDSYRFSLATGALSPL